MKSFWQDLRYGVRMLVKNPGFTAVVIVTLALGIGANTAIFTVVNAVLIQPLPYQDPDGLVRITSDMQKLGRRDVGVSAPELFDLKKRTTVFAEIAGVLPVNSNLTGGDEPARIETHLDSGNYFKVLGVNAALGRVFGPEDEVPGNATVAVISDGLWKRRFGTDPNILGRRIRIDNDAYTVIGVLPPEFRHPGKSIEREAEVWVPAGYSAAPWPTPPVRPARFIGVLARLKPGETIQTAQAELDSLSNALSHQYSNDYPANAGWALRVIPLQQDLTGNVRPALLVMLVVVGCVLLIACVNIANLLLARANARQGEIAIRIALGATRRRLVQQLLAESLFLSLLGGLLGLLFASLTLGGLTSLIPADLPRVRAIQIDGMVLGFTLAASVLTALIFGLVPALYGFTSDLQSTMKHTGTRVTSGEARNRLGSALVIAEFAVTLMLVVGAVLLVRSFWNLAGVSPGFRPQQVQTASVWLPVPNDPTTGPYFTPEKKIEFYKKVLERLQNLQGVDAVGGVDHLPLSGRRFQIPIKIEGRDENFDARIQTEWGQATPGYFNVMGIPLLLGRSFKESDNLQAQPVAIVSQTLVRKYFAGENPIGKHIQVPPGMPALPPGTPSWFVIIGVVGDTKDTALDAEQFPLMYTPVLQGAVFNLAFVLRTSATFKNPGGLAESVAQEVRAVDPEVPVYAARTMTEVVSRALSNRRFAMLLLVLFAGLALALSAIGIYGVMAYGVSQRIHEIGVRLVLGAQPRDVLRLVLKRGISMAVAGAVGGTVCAVALTHWMGSLLYGVSSTDPLTYIIAPTLLGFVAILACIVPAWRAANVDPNVALRYE
ncbi:MAG: ABC transporter permease [Candidatus Acidiferrales bacterium]